MSATATLHEIVLPVGDVAVAAALHAQVLRAAMSERSGGVALSLPGGTDIVLTPDRPATPDERARLVVVYGVPAAQFDAVLGSETSGASTEVVEVRVPGCGPTAYLRDSAGTVFGVEQRSGPDTAVARLEIMVERIEEAETFFETAFVLPPAERGLLPGAQRYVWIDLGGSGIMLREHAGRSGPPVTFDLGVSAEQYELVRRALARMKHPSVAGGTDSGVTVVDDGGGRQFRWHRQDAA